MPNRITWLKTLDVRNRRMNRNEIINWHEKIIFLFNARTAVDILYKAAATIININFIYFIVVQDTAE